MSQALVLPRAANDASAVVDATLRRSRPVVLTAAVLAMIPLTRSLFRGPKAIAVMGGLVVATALTLVFMPALYAAWFRVRRGAGSPAVLALPTLDGRTSGKT